MSIWCLFFFFPFVVDHWGSWITRVWHVPLGFEPTMCVELRVADSTSLLCNRHSESVNTCVIHAARWIMTHDWKTCICNLSSRRILHASCYFSPFVVVHWGSWTIRVWPTTWVELGVADSTSFLCNWHSGSVNKCVIHDAKWIITHESKSCICCIQWRYTSGEDILDISKDFDIPPCLLVRFLLEHMVGLQKHQITSCLRDPTSLPDSPTIFKVPVGCKDASNIFNPVSKTRLCADVYRCIDNDPVSSPNVEMIRRVTGLE